MERETSPSDEAKLFSASHADEVEERRGWEQGIANRKKILPCFSKTNPRGTISQCFHLHSYQGVGPLCGQLTPFVARAVFVLEVPLPAGNEQPCLSAWLWTLIRWHWALSPLTGLAWRTRLFFFAKKLHTMFLQLQSALVHGGLWGSD